MSEITGLAPGRKTVAAAGTPEALAASTPCKRVTITAETDNTGIIVVGDSTVVAALATRRGTPLSFSKAPIVQLTLTDTSLAPAWKSQFLKENGRFVGIEIAFSNAQINQTVEWMVMST